MGASTGASRQRRASSGVPGVGHPAVGRHIRRRIRRSLDTSLRTRLVRRHAAVVVGLGPAVRMLFRLRSAAGGQQQGRDVGECEESRAESGHRILPGAGHRLQFPPKRQLPTRRRDAAQQAIRFRSRNRAGWPVSKPWLIVDTWSHAPDDSCPVACRSDSSGCDALAGRRQHKLRIATVAPKSSAWGKLFKVWQRAVDKKTHGKLQLVVYYNGVQGSDDAMVGKMKKRPARRRCAHFGRPVTHLSQRDGVAVARSRGLVERARQGARGHRRRPGKGLREAGLPHPRLGRRGARASDEPGIRGASPRRPEGAPPGHVAERAHGAGRLLDDRPGRSCSARTDGGPAGAAGAEGRTS